jgi:hypothetical protein
MLAIHAIGKINMDVDSEDILLKNISFDEIKQCCKLTQMQKKIEDVIQDLQAIRKEMPEQHWLKTRILTNECLLRLALIDAEKAGIRKEIEK